jgi:hypothetical protein
VRYLLDKGANTELVDSNGHKAIDLLSAGARGGAAPAPPAATGTSATPPPAGTTPPTAERPGSGAGRGGPGGGGAVSPATVAEIRTLLQNAASKK